MRHLRNGWAKPGQALLAAMLSAGMAIGALPAAAQPAAAERSFVLGSDDVIDVQLYGQFPQPIRLRIRSDGTIVLPLVGALSASGQTPEQLTETIREAYTKGRYFNNVVVNVEVVTYTSRRVTLLGAVRTPGLVPLVRASTLTAVIAQAGGQTGVADVAIVRRADGTEARYVISQVAGTAADPVLRSGDVVIVPQDERFFVYGQARAPGSFPLTPGLTFRQALAQAGGQNDAGTERAIRLHRGKARTEITDLDTPIQAGDVLFIRERIF